MSDHKDDIEIPGWQQFLLLAGVSIVIILIIFIGGLIFDSGDSGEVNFSNCETRFDSTSCPEPDYDAELEETIRQYSDESN